MKKLKIIVPALALLAVSTVASVTGTVAWFTSNTASTVEFDQFDIQQMSSNLGCTTTAKVGVAVTNNKVTPAVISGSKVAKLTHASFNSDDGNIWSLNATNAKTKIDGPSSVSTKTDHLTSTNTKLIASYDKSSTSKAAVYYVFSWSSTFTYELQGTDAAANLYFDVKSTFTYTAQPTKQYASHKGFRLSMIRDDGSFVVWSPAQKLAMEDNNGTAAGGANRYVKDASTNTNYVAASTTGGNCIALGQTALDTIDPSATGTTSRADYLGQFTSSKSSLTVTFVAWFEGEDPNIINETTPNPVKASLGFYIRGNTAA